MVSVAHLIPAPFTQQAARAFYDEEELNRFYCTLVNEPGSMVQKSACAMAKVIGKDLRRDLKRREVTEIPEEKLKLYPCRETLRMIGTRLIKDPIITDSVFHWGRDGFDRWVASKLQSENAIYSFEYACLEMFKSAKRQGIGTIYDVPSPEHDFVERLLAPEFDRFADFDTPYRRKTLNLHIERTKRRELEWEYADLVVANSSFTARSWKSAGWTERPIAVVPYGAPPVTSDPRERTASDRSGSLKVIWAGTFGVRKGAHVLIEALRSLPESSVRSLEINIFGTVTLPNSMNSLPECLNFRGTVPRHELLEEMRQSDVLLFPTLCDGFGLVANEALSQGLPVITTRRAGAADLIDHEENGFLIDAGESLEIAEVLQRCLDERELIAGMRDPALKKAASWQWSDYRKGIVAAVRSANLL